MGILVACIFWSELPRKGAQLFFRGCDLRRNYGILVTLFYFLGNYDNLTLKLNQEKRSYPDKRWLFIVRFKVGSVPEKSGALVASKKVSKSIMIWCKAINKVIIVINSPIYK